MNEATKQPKRSQEPHRVGTLNNTALQRARRLAGIPKLRAHDLGQTFGLRLSDAGKSAEDRALQLCHAIADMTQLSANTTVARPVDQANQGTATRDRATLLRVVNG